MIAGIRVLCAVFALLTSSVYAQDADRAYNEGNALYRSGDFEGAVKRYQAVLDLGIRHADVYYNLGNAHFKLGELGKALLSYERARRLSPSDADILANIDYVNAVKVDRFDIDPPNAVTRFLSAVYGALSINGLAWGVAIGILVLCVGIGRWLYADSRRVRWLVVAAIALVFFGTSSFLLSLKVGDLNAPEAIVLSDQVEGRSGPGEDYLQVFTLHEGTKVTIERQEGPWGLIRLPNGIGGWVPLGSVSLI